MLFNSGQFLIFFPIVVLVYYVFPKKIKNLWLLIASYYFYMCWNAKYALLLLTSTVVTWAGGLILEMLKRIVTVEKKKNAIILQRIILVAILAINLGILFSFKYLNFCMEIIRDIALFFSIELSLPVFDIVLPVGISFYIFQSLGYLIDVYRDNTCAEKNFLHYALFISFFPQILAGPIGRAQNLLKQFDSPKKFDTKVVRDGLLVMLWGFFLKLVIADRCSILVNTVYTSYETYEGIQLVVANIMLALQIYCDFMGYSTIAKGAAKVIGINLVDNFNQPYLATSIKDFWRRWHISLSTWFRDYLYIPLGGSRCSQIKQYRNLFITFMVSGLWHGANLTYVIWGILHGIYQIIEDIIEPFTNKIVQKLKIDLDLFSWKLLRIIKTFILVDIAWIFFRANSIHSAWYILKSSFDISNLGILLNDGIYQLGLDIKNMNILFFATVFLIIASYLKEKGINVMQWIEKQNFLFRYSLYWGALFMIILSLDITGQEFIYFQF